MKRFRILGLALVAVFALGAMAAGSAQAVTAPFWSIGGKRLPAGSTHNIDARALPGGPGFTLVTPAVGVTINCKALQLEKGVLLGSNEGEAGKDNEIAVFSNCKVEGNGTNCKVKEPIRTNPLTSKLVEVVKGKQLLEEFKPTTGSTFVDLIFEAGCTIEGEVAVVGGVAAEVLTDPGKEKIELGQAAKEATSWLVNFPNPGISEVLLVNNTKGTVEVTKLKPLEVFSNPSTLEGTVLTLLANTKFESERSQSWSPLP